MRVTKFSIVRARATMVVAVLLILALIVFGVGFAVHLLWWLLIVLLVIAILGWLFGRRRA